MSAFRSIPVEQLSRRSGARREDFDAIATLADSIAKVGLTNPITVREKPDGDFEIIAGSHRYAACDSLGHREIMCQVVEMGDLHAELAMIDENLCRAELSPSDRAAQTARRKVIYEELHPETAVGENQHTRVRQLGEGSAAERFTANTASATGQSERKVQRDAERGKKVIDEVLDMIRGTKLDTGAYLDEVKRVPREEQVEKVRRDLSAPRAPALPSTATSKQEAPAPAATAAPDAADMVRRFIAATDDLAKIDFDAVAAGAPLKMRANLQGRCRPYIDLFSKLDDALEGRSHA